MAYKLLYQDDRIEVRKYPPCCRTLLVQENYSGKVQHYFVPLPYQVYSAVKHDNCNGYGPGRYFFTAFAKKDDRFVYCNPFRGTRLPICIDNRWHYRIPNAVDMSEAIARYWSTYFWHTDLIGSVFQVETHADWSKLNKRQVIRRLKYSRLDLEDLINTFKRITGSLNRRY